jgi:hypothetical protein
VLRQHPKEVRFSNEAKSSQHIPNVTTHLSLCGKGTLEVPGGQQPFSNQPLAK